MLDCIEIKTENDAENIIMLLCKTVMHPHCYHGIQFWSQNLEEISVEIEMVGRWAVNIIKGKEKLVYEQRWKGHRLQQECKQLPALESHCNF